MHVPIHPDQAVLRTAPKDRRTPLKDQQYVANPDPEEVLRPNDVHRRAEASDEEKQRFLQEHI